MVENIGSAYGRTRQSVESAILQDFELIAFRKGLRVSPETAEQVRGFAIAIVEHVLERGGAGRMEAEGRRYTAHERDRNLESAIGLGRKVAERAVMRAREGKAEVIVEELWIGSRRMRYQTTTSLFASLCPPPLPPICK